MSNYILTNDGELYHWGVKGMKWGVRRYQNKDGSLKPAGKKRIAKNEAILADRDSRFSNKAANKGANIVAGMIKGTGIGAGIGAATGAARTLLDSSGSFGVNVLLMPLGAAKGAMGGAMIGAGAGAVAGMFKKNEK